MDIAQVVRFLAFGLWLLAIGVGITVLTRAGRGQNSGGLVSLTIGLFVGAVVVTVLGSGLVFINPQERGVVISALDAKGYREEALQPGLRFVVPFAEQVVTYPISRQTFTMSSSEAQNVGGYQDGGQVMVESVAARTRDGQQISVDASVIYAIDPSRVVDVHIAWQTRYQEGLVLPLARGIIRDQVSQYGVEEVVSTKRAEMVEKLTASMTEKLDENGLILVDFVLRNITFSEEYANSVEQKQIAEQLALQAEFVVEQKRQEAEQARQVAQGTADAAVIAAKGDAEARLIQAEAEAKALELVAQVLAQNPSLLTYEYIQRLAPNINVMLVPSDAPFILPSPNSFATPQ